MRRTRSEVVASLEDYWVLEVDRNLVGCVAMHVWPEDNVAELACLYVSRTHENQGYGHMLMTFVENQAKSRGISHVFALSTRAFAYLQQKGGFKEASMDFLPPARRKRYEESGRNSKILVKEIVPATARQ